MVTVPRREYIWTHDLEGEQNGVIGHGFVDLWHDERLDQSEQFGFQIAADNPKVGLLIRDGELLHRGRRFFITELEESRQGSVTTVTVEADALWYRLGELTYPGSFVLEGMSPARGVANILDGTGWNTSPSNASTSLFSMEQQDKTRLALLRTWAKITGSMLVFDTAGRSVNLATSRGRELGLAFRYGRNLTGVRRRSRPPELTVLYPYGADDLTVAGINGGSPYVEDFSYYTDLGLDLSTARNLYTRSKVWSDSSFIIDSDLLAAAEARLALKSQPAVSYELKVVDLSEITGNAEDVQVADRVRVFDPDLGADVRATVTRVRRYRLQPWRNQIELSTSITPLSDGSSSTRPSRSAEWVQFVGPVRADYQIRNDGDYTTNRIALAFRNGGRANFHVDLNAVGVGDGVMHVEVVDANNGDAQQFYELDISYLDGQPVRALLQWATEDLVGAYDFRVRVTTVADGGPSASAGVDIAADVGAEASFWIMAQGAIQETPVAANSERFEWLSTGGTPGTGNPQYFTVPDGVTELEVEVAGAKGGDSASPGGGGAIVTATFAAIPGTIYEVNAAGPGAVSSQGGWPNGGAGADPAADPSGGGGGSSDIRPVAGADATAVIVAAGGGGSGRGTLSFPGSYAGGGGGFYNGGDGWNNDVEADPTCGLGATQAAGGAAGEADHPSGADGSPGSFMQGGDCGGHGGSFTNPGGGGGGGWYGGGGAGQSILSGGFTGGGGGGSSWVAPAAAATDLIFQDGANDAAGYIEFRWETPG